MHLPPLTLSDAQITHLEAQVATLLERVAALEAALARNFPPTCPAARDPLATALGP